MYHFSLFIGGLELGGLGLVELFGKVLPHVNLLAELPLLPIEQSEHEAAQAVLAHHTVGLEQFLPLGVILRIELRRINSSAHNTTRHNTTRHNTTRHDTQYNNR
jgi:hypothetical protein